MTRVLHTIGAVAAASMVAGCGPDAGPADWIDARAAVVHCTSSGRDRMPPVLLDLPVPAPPTGLYARRLDPMALDDLGFQRDAVACAMLLHPDPTTSGEALAAARLEAERAAVRLVGGCACEAAALLEARELLPRCVDEPTRRRCDVADQIDAMTEILAPVEAALAQTHPPLLHWRLVGKTDRPHWFARQQETLLGRHEGGSTVFVRGQAVPRRGNGALVDALLAEDDVVAVVRQDSGQALLVVREVGKSLVFDHFRHPAVGDTLMPVLPFIDNASVDRYRALLAKPTQTRKLRLAPGKGNVIEVDVTHLAAIDEAIVSGAELLDDRPAPTRSLPERRVELVTVQAPFGEEGKRLDARIELTSEGARWAALLTSSQLLPGLEGLSLEPVEVPEIETDLPYVLAGSAFERSVVYGLEAVPTVMREVEDRYPGAIEGTEQEWAFTMPLSDMAGFVSEGSHFSGLRAAFTGREYEATVKVVDEARALEVTLAPAD